MRALNLDQLEAFAQVVELGSFSAAAERLALTQPAVSQQVKLLEQRLGVTLLERVGRRATPTAAGSDLLNHIRDIDGAVAATLEAMAQHATGRLGRVRLGSGATACIYFLPAILRQLRHRFPGLEIVVKTGNTPEVLKLLEENRLDLALVTLPAPGRMFQVTPLLDDEFVAIAATDDARLPLLPTPAALAPLPIVLYEAGAHTRRLVDEWFLAAGISVKPIMELGSVEAIKELVAAGLGCSLLPQMALGAGDERFARRRPTPRLGRTLGLVLRRDKPLNRGLREVIKALRAAAGLQP